MAATQRLQWSQGMVGWVNSPEERRYYNPDFPLLFENTQGCHPPWGLHPF